MKHPEFLFSCFWNCLPRLTRWGLLLILCLGNLSGGFAQSEVQLRKQYPYSLMEDEALLRLRANWKHEGDRNISLPFQPGNLSTAELSISFEMPPGEGDSVYVFFEGLAWEAQLQINGRFLGINHQPLADWWVPVARSWLLPQGNQLALSLRKNGHHPQFPEPFLGLTGEAVILSRAQLQQRKMSVLEKVEADTVAILAPDFRWHGYSFDTFEAMRTLYPLRRMGIRAVYFPFPANRQFRALCAEVGLKEVESLQADTYVCLINAYQYDPGTFGKNPHFWMDREGNYTTHFGDMFQWGDQHRVWKMEQNNGLLAFLILFPLLAAALIKLLSPGFFSGQWNLLINPKRFVDSPAESLYTNSGLLWSLFWIKTLCFAFFISLGMYYLELAHAWAPWQQARPESLAIRWFMPASNLWELLGRSLLVLLLGSLLKMLVLGMVSQIFRIKALVPKIISIEVIGTFPLILLLHIPLALVIVGQSWGHTFLLLSLSTMLAAYFLRWVYVSFIGIDRLFAFSSAMKFLYICTFILIPYLVWI